MACLAGACPGSDRCSSSAKIDQRRARHDGFTLNDLVSYNRKHNEANGEINRDGSDDNLSWNCGVEGPTDDPRVEALRNRQVKNFFALELLSAGTPMLLMGDEVRRSQRGNNNGYCQELERQLVRLDPAALLWLWYSGGASVGLGLPKALASLLSCLAEKQIVPPPAGATNEAVGQYSTIPDAEVRILPPQPASPSPTRHI